jgi:uroporphyrinogen-III synthase
VAQILDSSIMLPAPAQGILAIEIREEDDELRALLALINDPKASIEAIAERALLAELGGGCRVRVGALARVIGDTITLSGCVCSPDGTTVLKTEQSGRLDEAKEIGQRAAAALIEAGAERVIAASLQAVEDHHRTPLTGKKVVVTRSREQSEELVSMLEELGAKVMAFPTIDIVACDSGDPKYPLPKYDWLILTSPNAARMFFSQLAARGLGAGDLKSLKVAVVGPGTAEVVRDEGLHVDLMPGKHLADQLFEALLACDPMFEGKRVLLPRSDIAHRFLPDQLAEHGADVTEWVVYRTARPHVSEDKVQALVHFAPDVVMFTSSSTVDNFCAIAGPARLDALRKHTVFASIGPVTTETAREHGLNITIEPEVHDIPGLVETLVEALTMRTE